jgi:hypothetical protein
MLISGGTEINPAGLFLSIALSVIAYSPSTPVCEQPDIQSNNILPGQVKASLPE